MWHGVSELEGTEGAQRVAAESPVPMLLSGGMSRAWPRPPSRSGGSAWPAEARLPCSTCPTSASSTWWAPTPGRPPTGCSPPTSAGPQVRGQAGPVLQASAPGRAPGTALGTATRWHLWAPPAHALPLGWPAPCPDPHVLTTNPGLQAVGRPAPSLHPRCPCTLFQKGFEVPPPCSMSLGTAPSPPGMLAPD